MDITKGEVVIQEGKLKKGYLWFCTPLTVSYFIFWYACCYLWLKTVSAIKVENEVEEGKLANLRAQTPILLFALILASVLFTVLPKTHILNQSTFFVSKFISLQIESVKADLNWRDRF